MKTYEVKNDLGIWPSFTVNVNKQGIITWCSDNSHPNGAVWESIKSYYESYTGDLKCTITEIQ